MPTYTLSRREKALVAILLLLLAVLAWYTLVFRATNDRIEQLDQQLAETRTETEVQTARLEDLRRMRETIAVRKAEGATATSLPTYDNVKAVMAELDAVLAATQSYSLSFDDLVRWRDDYVRRGVSASMECASYADAVGVVRALSEGACPCSVDRVSLSMGPGGACQASLHVTFYERR